MNWFSSDHHWFHKNILKYEPDRPFKTLEEMNIEMIKRWNNKVSKKDNVYYCGDLSFGSKEETIWLLSQLNGNIFLIEGNHDHIVRDRDVREKFGWVKPYYKLKQDNKKIILFHYPIQVWDSKHYGSLHFYGHVHSNVSDHGLEYNNANSYNVGVDVNGYEPVSLEEILKFWEYEKSVKY